MDNDGAPYYLIVGLKTLKLAEADLASGEWYGHFVQQFFVRDADFDGVSCTSGREDMQEYVRVVLCH